MPYLRTRRNWGAEVFGRFTLRDRLAEQSSKLREAIERHDVDEVLTRPVQDLVDEFVARFDLEPPALLWEEAEQSEPTETTLEVADDFRYGGYREGGTRRVHGTRISVGIPVTGTIELLGGNASTSLMKAWQNTAVQDGQLIIWNEWTQATPEAVSSWYERERSDIQRQVEPIQRDVSQWRAGLSDLATKSIESRRQRLLRNRGLEGALGLPVRRRNEQPRPVPVRRTKVATTRARKASSPAFVPEPELDERTYAEVLDIICAFGRGMERSPSTAAKFNEEELRDQILMHLNGHFEGEAGGELFNGAGKTDILIRHQDRNVFIGECKFWEGQKKLSEAIDQLSSYMVWRDTKAALILFIKRKDPSACIARAQEAIRAHESFKRDGRQSPDAEGYTTFVVRHGDDADREIRLALVPVVIRWSEGPPP